MSGRMKLFAHAHATHPQPSAAVSMVLAQLRAQLAAPAYAQSPSLGLVYFTDHYVGAAQDILDQLSAELPEVVDWTGTVGIGIAANNVEYFDEPALAVMLCELPVDQYRVFSGVSPLPRGFDAQSALVHADPSTPDLAELIAELADRTTSGYLFGGVASSRARTVQVAWSGAGNLRGQGHAGGVFQGGFSGVAFGPGVRLVSRVTQGCFPIGRQRRITACDGHVILEIDGMPALDTLLAELGVSLDRPREALEAVRATLAGITSEAAKGMTPTGFGEDTIVRHIIGLDPARRGVAIAERLDVDQMVAFCRRDVQAARADLMRVCAEVRDELEPMEMSLSAAMELTAGELPRASTGHEPHDRPIRGAIYVSCTGRGGPHFGAPSAELQIVRRALGDVPLIGFFANGEIAHHRLYGYTGVLTVFAGQA